MNLPDLDPELFSATEITALGALATKCEEAVTAKAIETAGAELDAKRAKSRDAVKKAINREKVLNAFYKQLIFQVPRRSQDVKDDEGNLIDQVQVAVIE